MPRSGGGGGTNNMQAMAQQRDAMSQKVIDALEKLSGSLEALQGSGGQGGGKGSGGVAGGGIGGAPSVGGGMGGGRSRGVKFGPDPTAGWNLSGKSGSASEVPISALQGILGAGGLNGASSLLGGLAGGPAGVAGLAIGAVRSQYQSDQNVKNAGFESYANSPIHESETSRLWNAEHAKNLKQLEEDDNSWGMAISRSVNVYDQGPNRPGTADRSRQEYAQAILNERQTIGDYNDTREGAVGRAEAFFSRFAQAGMMPSREAIKKVLEVTRIQTQNQINIHTQIEEEFGKIILGAHGKHGGKQ